MTERDLHSQTWTRRLFAQAERHSLNLHYSFSILLKGTSMTPYHQHPPRYIPSLNALICPWGYRRTPSKGSFLPTGGHCQISKFRQSINLIMLAPTAATRHERGKPSMNKSGYRWQFMFFPRSIWANVVLSKYSVQIRRDCRRTCTYTIYAQITLIFIKFPLQLTMYGIRAYKKTPPLRMYYISQVSIKKVSIWSLDTSLNTAKK